MTAIRFLLVLFVSANLLYGQDTEPVVSTPAAQRIMDHVKILSSEEAAGRSPNTEGIERAAKYIVMQYKQMGLEPMGDHGTYRNAFEMTSGVKLGEKNSVWVNIKRERPGVPMEKVRPTKVGWQVGRDYHPFGFSQSGTASGPVVFVGYGISAPGMKYDDYEGLDVKGGDRHRYPRHS